MSLLCLLFLLDFAAIGDIYEEEEGEVPLSSETMKTTYCIARSAFQIDEMKLQSCHQV